MSAEVGIFPRGDIPRGNKWSGIWHPVRGPHTYCGLWPDIFIKYEAVKPFVHASTGVGGRCRRASCRCNNPPPMCRNCAKATP